LKRNACAAFAVEEAGQEQLVVVQEIARPQKLDLDAIAAVIRHDVETEYRVPFAALVFIKPGTLPKTSSGKPQRYTARDLFLSTERDSLKQWRFPSVLARVFAAEGERDLPSRDEIHGWLLQRVARHCAVAADQIDPSEPLTRYIMDSVSAVAIAMELQQWL